MIARSLFIFCAVFLTFHSAMMRAVEAQTKEAKPRIGISFDGMTSKISAVVKGGPADSVGMQVGDVILSADEKYILQPADFGASLYERKIGEKIRLEVMRGNQIQFFNVEIMLAVANDEMRGQDGQVLEVEPKLGILDELAPELTLDRWHDLPAGFTPRLKALQGKVVCLLLFQSDCPYSERHGVPQLKKIHEEFKNDDSIVIMAVHTPFRNFEENTHGAAIKMFQEMGVNVPLGHDGSAKQRSKTYDAYKAYGTPWIVVIDQKGVVRFNDSRLPIREARTLFSRLKSATPASSAHEGHDHEGHDHEGHDHEKKHGMRPAHRDGQ